MTDRTPAQVIFLGGLGRSGTTLLERLLGELPGVVALGEVVHLWERGVLAEELCGCGASFLSCPFWRFVGERAFGGWTRGSAERILKLRARIDRTRRIPRIGHPDLAEYVRAYRLLYDATGAQVVVDSSKHASLARCLIAGGVDLKIVHVVRDPRAVAHSWSRTVRRPEDGRPMTRWSPARTAVHWTAQNAALELLPMRRARVTRIRYEDLLAAPADTLRALAFRLGLPEPELPFLHGRTAWLGHSHTASGNPMRFHVGRIELRRDDSWRSGLAAADRRVVSALTWPLRARYGYRGAA
ncbi:sulfotransferase family protein [Nonomuraea fuscirosea]|uniref:Sulfotransferase family protein n=1 Tax=Nonomuraea fuscirosea TaxID=1291556 RepID=A0A2T0N0R8_9ACTN|nr:sulfotransferase [Nonomuraea fuscirosea]PRX65363.1 sulfotransferase family protein [Nonomuraea fuscirosea]